MNHQEEDVVESLEVSAPAMGPWVLDELPWGFPTCLGRARFFIFFWQENARFFMAKNNPLSHVRILISSVAGTGWNNQCGISFL